MDSFQKDQAHQIARHYDTQLWAIPAVLLALIAFELQAIECPFVSWKNLLIFMIAMISSLLLLLLFNKIHFQQLRMARMMREGKDKLASFYSIRKEEIPIEIERLRMAPGFEFNFIMAWLTKRTVSSWFKVIMILVLIVNLIFAIYISYDLMI